MGLIMDCKLPLQLALEPCHRKFCARTIRFMSAGNVAVAVYPESGYSIAFLQEPDQLSQLCHLPCRWNGFIKITDKTYPNSVFVGPVTNRSANMGACPLLFPAESYLDQSVGTVRAVVYHKVIPYPIPAVAFMPAVYNGFIAVRRSRMVYYNRCPALFDST